MPSWSSDGLDAISMAGMAGMMGGSMQSAAETSGMATAMSQFVGSAMNKSGVQMPDMQAAHQQIEFLGRGNPQVALPALPH